MRLLTVGDSITAAGQWQAELSRLCALTGVELTTVNVAVGGVATNYWPTRIKALLSQHSPDAVTFYTGTNDDVNGVMHGESATTWSFRSTVETIHEHRPSNRVVVIPAWIQYSDPLIAPQWLLDSEPVTNDRIFGEIYRHRDWLSSVADFQPIPATADYLDDGGIHPTSRGYRAMGRITYDSLRARVGWPVCPEPPLCGMYGHRKGYPRPVYIRCESAG
jgi:lysophospholipase L1-like esterase